MNKIACDYSDRVSSSFFRKDSLQRNAMLVDLVPSYTFGFAGVPVATLSQNTSISFTYASCQRVTKS